MLEVVSLTEVSMSHESHTFLGTFTTYMKVPG